MGSVTCSYNAVDGIPSCASKYLLDEVLRQHWDFTAYYNYGVSDCGSVTDNWQYHNFTDTEEATASVALNAGVDLECGSSYLKLNQSLAAIDQALTRLYFALFTVGFFAGGKFSSYDFSDASTPASQLQAYEAAVEGMVLLKNDKVLPLGNRYRSVAVIGPYANATTQLQGDYAGTAPYLRSPLGAFQSQKWEVNYAMGTAINNQSTAGFAAALEAAKNSDVIVYLGALITLSKPNSLTG